jgi:hypothetical protein
LVVVNGSTVRGGHDGSLLVIVIHC